MLNEIEIVDAEIIFEVGGNNYFNKLEELVHGHPKLKSLRFVAYGFKKHLEKNKYDDDDDDEEMEIHLLSLKLENVLKNIMTDAPFLVNLDLNISGLNMSFNDTYLRAVQPIELTQFENTHKRHH